MVPYSADIKMEKEHEFVLKILHVSPECAPLAKKGGLGDVAGALPKALRKNDIDARVLMPAWPGVLDPAARWGPSPRPLTGAPSPQSSGAPLSTGFPFTFWKTTSCSRTKTSILKR